MVGGVVSKDELKRWLDDCYSVEFIDKSDAVRGLSSHLVCGLPGNRLTVAVGGDARPETVINALLDLLAWQWQMTVERQSRLMRPTCWSATVSTRTRCWMRCGRWSPHRLVGHASACISRTSSLCFGLRAGYAATAGIGRPGPLPGCWGVAMDHAALLRPEDFVVLDLSWHDLAVRPAGGESAFAVLEPSGASPRLIVTFPPQHLAEQVYPAVGGEDPEGVPPGFFVAARSLAGPSRLGFVVPPDHPGIPLTVEGILAAIRALPLAVAAPGSMPGDHESRLELPWRLLISPPAGAGFAHAAGPARGPGDRVELWHTRMGSRTSGGAAHPVDEHDPSAKTLRAVAARGGDGALSSSLSSDERAAIVRRGAELGEDPVHVRLLALSGLGAWLDGRGSWETTGITEWSHRAAMGRDAHVRVVRRGALFPLGHTAVYIEVCERRPHMAAQTCPAILRRQRYIVVTEPLREYAPGERVARDGSRYDRTFPFDHCQLRTSITPLLDEPTPLHAGRIGPPAQVAFWPTAGGNRVAFTAVLSGREGRDVLLSLPMIFIADEPVDGVSALKSPEVLSSALLRYEAGQPWLGVGGQPIALAEGPPGSTTFEVQELQLTAGPAAPPDRLVGFHPMLGGLGVEMPALRQLLGTAGPIRGGFAREFATTGGGGGFGPGNPAELLLRLSAPVSVDFTGRGDRVGGLVTPTLVADAVSRADGLIPSIGVLTGDPRAVFQTLRARLLGAISLADVVASAGPHDVPKLLTEAIAPGAAPSLHYSWKPSLKSEGIFRAERDGRAAALSVEVTADPPTAPGVAVSTRVTSELLDFTLDLFHGGEDVLRLTFERLRFAAEPGRKPTVDVRLANVEFRGVLSFVEALQSLIPTGGGGAAPALEVSAAGVRSHLSTAVPDLAFGVFSLQNVSVEVGFAVPFLGDPVGASFAFCTRERPFLLTVSGFGGGGYLGMAVDARGMRMLEASFDFGASVSMNFGVASGGVAVMGGFLFQLEGQTSARLTGYLKISGELEVLGLVSVSILLALSLFYDFTTGKCVGKAVLVLEVEVGFFSTSVSLECERRFGGANGDPPLRETMGPDRDEFPWLEYCRAFRKEASR
jgi:hypothetical protein